MATGTPAEVRVEKAMTRRVSPPAAIRGRMVSDVLIRQGESHPGDGQTHVTLHLTENANGEVTANFENGRGVCL